MFLSANEETRTSNINQPEDWIWHRKGGLNYYNKKETIKTDFHFIILTTDVKFVLLWLNEILTLYMFLFYI